MRYTQIRSHLKPYSIVANRTTTVSHAFAAAIAPCDTYDEQNTRAAVRQLGQDPDRDLVCVYCGFPAETWDHVNATVRDKKFSGFGHRLGNLLPCCKPCNSKKGNRHWSAYVDSLDSNPAELARRKGLIEAYLGRYCVSDSVPKQFPEYEELQNLREQVLEIFSRADVLAAQLRTKVRAESPAQNTGGN